MSRRDAGGFTLIEVLAAIVIFSTGAVVLFGWIGQTADRLVLVNREERLLFAQLGALEFARTLNPTLRPTGTEQIGETTVRWASQEVGAPAPSYNPAGSAGAYLVQLYRVKLEVEAGANLSAEKTIYLAGWQQTRPAGVRGAFDTTPLPASPGTP